MAKAIDDHDRARAIVQKEADRLGERIANAISVCIVDHRRECGWSPVAISVQMVDTTEIGDKRRRAIVGGVTVTPPVEPVA